MNGWGSEGRSVGRCKRVLSSTRSDFGVHIRGWEDTVHLWIGIEMSDEMMSVTVEPWIYAWGKNDLR